MSHVHIHRGDQGIPFRFSVSQPLAYRFNHMPKSVNTERAMPKEEHMRGSRPSPPEQVEFDFPLMMEGKLVGNPQFEGVTRRFRIGREAIGKAIEIDGLEMPMQDIYDAFFFDIWMRLKKDVWSREPTEGVVLIGVDDFT